MADFNYYESPTWVDIDVDGNIPDDAPALSAENLQNMSDAVANALPRTGGEMTGSLILKGEPSESSEATNKGYVDKNIVCVTWKDKEWVDKDTAFISIPNWTVNMAEKYIAFFVCADSRSGHRYSRITLMGYDTFQNVSGNNNSSINVKISKDGRVFCESSSVSRNLDGHFILFVPCAVYNL